MTKQEAIKIVKEFINGTCLHLVNQEALETLIPELKESEDEKIRKELIEYLTHRAEVTGFITEAGDCKRWIDYLEKQEEQKSKRDIVSSDAIESCMLRYLQSAANRKDDIEIIEDTKAYKSELISIIEKEQKLTEWNEEDRQCFDEAIEALESLGFDGEASNLKSLRDYRKPLNTWKPAGWSNEDELKRNNLIGLIEEIKRQPLKRLEDWDGYINWLKSLRSQPKAELTLLDKNIIEAAVAFVEQNNHFSCWGGIDKHTVIKALRSLKPYWKPSEEQIKAIRLARSFVVDDFDEHPTLSEILMELEEQLKKL